MTRSARKGGYRPAPAPRPVQTVQTSALSGCRCKPGPFLMATFRNEQLVSVELIHGRRGQLCRLDPEPLDPVAYLEGSLR